MQRPEPQESSSSFVASSADPVLEDLWLRSESNWLRESAMHSADAWVWERGDRDALLPVTGAVPFNGEPPLSELAAHLVTPTKLHHVRNHGPVPRIDEQTYRLQICVEGAAPKDIDIKDEAGPTPPVKLLRTWSLSELRDLPSRTLLVTITCNGVRRKELNQIEHTKGANTGPGATGTSEWSGVLLTDLLRLSGVSSDASSPSSPSHPFVVFDGLDKPAKGFYGTSLPSTTALDPRGEVLVAWQQNGLPLTPDHGAPLRLVVPGQVGARSIKWLGRILLSHSKSRSHYHAEDNILVPSSANLSDFNGGKFFGRPEFVLYEQLVNSTITRPSHEQWISLAEHQSPGSTPVTVEGFASAGGGRRILRVELSPDGGRTWKSCKLRYADVANDAKEHDDADAKERDDAQGLDEKKGELEAAISMHTALSHRPKCWAWTFWSVELPAWQLMSPGSFKEICVRAFDEAFNSQTSDIRWNAMGMMNNSYYRVRVETQVCNEVEGSRFLRFQHPVMPGSNVGGWLKAAPSSLSRRQDINLPHSGPSLGLAAHRAHKLISAEEVACHQSADDVWFEMDGMVYDVTPYMKDHPGGPDALRAATKIPAPRLSSLFKSIHAADAFEILGRFAIGVLAKQELIDALTLYDDVRGVGAGVGGSPRFFLESLQPDQEDAAMSGSKLALPSSKEGNPSGRRRSHWQEVPNPKLLHPRTNALLFPPRQHPCKFLLHSTRWCAIKLLKVKTITHDSKLFTFGAASGSFDAIGLTTGQHVLLAARVGDEFVVRPYTPVWPVSLEEDEPAPEDVAVQPQAVRPLAARSSEDSTKNEQRHVHSSPDQRDSDRIQRPKRRSHARFELLIKIYRRHGVMPGGKLTSYLDTLEANAPNDTLRVKGPTGHVLYLGEGYFNIHQVPVRVRYVNLIGGGTGITPLWQLMRVMLSSPNPAEHAFGVNVSLVFANKSEADILMRDDLETLVAQHPERARLVHVLSREAPVPPHEPLRQQQMHARSDAITRQFSPSPESAAASPSTEALSGSSCHPHPGDSQPSSLPSSPRPSPSPSSFSKSGGSTAAGSARQAHVSTERGHVNAYIFRHHLYPPSLDTLTFVCGPPPMVSATFDHLLALGFSDESIVEF